VSQSSASPDNNYFQCILKLTTFAPRSESFRCSDNMITGTIPSELAALSGVGMYTFAVWVAHVTCRFPYVGFALNQNPSGSRQIG